MSYDSQGGDKGHATYAQAKKDAKRLASYGCPIGKLPWPAILREGISNPGLVLTYGDLVSKVGADLDPTSDVLGKDSAIGFNNVLTVQKTKWRLRMVLPGSWFGRSDRTLLMQHHHCWSHYDTKWGSRREAAPRRSRPAQTHGLRKCIRTRQSERKRAPSARSEQEAEEKDQNVISTYREEIL